MGQYAGRIRARDAWGVGWRLRWAREQRKVVVWRRKRIEVLLLLLLLLLL